MTKDFWINLPVKDIKHSGAFFTKIGFSFNPGPGNTDNSACLVVGSKNTVIMLFAVPAFKQFTGQEITDTGQTSEVFIVL